MNYLKILLVLVFVALAVFACSTRKPTRSGIVIADSSSYEATIYRQNCAICHGREASGKKVDGKLIPSLRFGKAAAKTEEELYSQIANGKLPMPAFKDQLTEKELRRMAKFVMSDLQGRKSAADE